MVHLLEADYVGVLGQELLQDPPTSRRPEQSSRVTSDQLVALRAETLRQVVPLQHPDTVLSSSLTGQVSPVSLNFCGETLQFLLASAPKIQFFPTLELVKLPRE